MKLYMADKHTQKTDDNGKGSNYLRDSHPGSVTCRKVGLCILVKTIIRIFRLLIHLLIDILDLLAHMDIAKSQLQEWLKRAINDGHIKRLQKPVRYEWRGHEPIQGSMFDRT